MHILLPLQRSSNVKCNPRPAYIAGGERGNSNVIKCNPWPAYIAGGEGGVRPSALYIFLPLQGRGGGRGFENPNFTCFLHAFSRDFDVSHYKWTSRMYILHVFYLCR